MNTLKDFYLLFRNNILIKVNLIQYFLLLIFSTYVIFIKQNFESFKKILIVMFLIESQIWINVFCFISKLHKFLSGIQQQTCRNLLSNIIFPTNPPVKCEWDTTRVSLVVMLEYKCISRKCDTNINSSYY